METRNVYETDDEVQALALQEALESAAHIFDCLRVVPACPRKYQAAVDLETGVR